MATIEERLTGQDVSGLTGGESATSTTSVNVGQVERWASAVGGGALALYGITRGSLGGIALALVGAALVQRGVTGHCNLYEAMNFDSAGGVGLRNSENVSVPGEGRAQRRHQPAGAGAVQLLAQLREPAELHEPPGVGQAFRRQPLALGGEGAGRDDRRVGRRGLQR